MRVYARCDCWHSRIITKATETEIVKLIRAHSSDGCEYIATTVAAAGSDTAASASITISCLGFRMWFSVYLTALIPFPDVLSIGSQKLSVRSCVFDSFCVCCVAHAVFLAVVISIEHLVPNLRVRPLCFWFPQEAPHGINKGHSANRNKHNHGE